jgi:FkbM family methyltransferase
VEPAVYLAARFDTRRDAFAVSSAKILTLTMAVGGTLPAAEWRNSGLADRRMEFLRPTATRKNGASQPRSWSSPAKMCGHGTPLTSPAFLSRRYPQSAVMLRLQDQTFVLDTTMVANHSAFTMTTSDGRQCELIFRKGTSDETLITQILENQEYSIECSRRGPEVLNLYQSIVKRGERPLILDLGANVGFATAYFSLTWPEAVIVGVEPESDNYSILKENIDRLKNPRLVALQAAVASRAGEIVVQTQSEPWAHTTAWATPEAPTIGRQRVETVTVNQLLSLNFAQLTGMSGPVVPFIAKIDIEGFEADLFSSNTEWFDRFPVVIIELHDWLFPGRAISKGFLQTTAGKDRDFVILGENIFSIKTLLNTS